MASQRKIEPSYKGRLRFLPGDDHPLDVMLGEAQLLLEQIRGALEGVVGTLDEMNQAGDPLTSTLAEDQTLQQFIRRRYAEHKHRDHILATFMALYRKRLLARLQAAQAALDLAREFLSPDNTFLENVQQALATGSPPADPRQAQLVGEPLRVKGNLKRYEERLQTIRKAITAGNGWFETFFVTRTRLKPKFRELARRRQPFPEGEDPYETVSYGPYLKYRWREGQGPIYTISMGLIPNAGSGEGGVEENETC
jgi:hypothetical protein